MPPLTPEEQAALVRAFIGSGTGSNQINDLENLFGFSKNLLAQAAIGVPGVDAEYISGVVQSLSYEPYDGVDPLALQQQINESMRRVASRLGIQPETMNAVAESVIAGTPPDVALAAISGVVFRDAEGNPRLDVSAAEQQEFDALGTILKSYQDAVDLEQGSFEVGGQRYVARDEADVRSDMEQLGLVGQFNDPKIWLSQPDQALSAAARQTAAQAEQAGAGVAGLRSQLAEAEKLASRPAAVQDRYQGIDRFFARQGQGGVSPTAAIGAPVDFTDPYFVSAAQRIMEGLPGNQVDAQSGLNRVAPGRPAGATAGVPPSPAPTYVAGGYGGAELARVAQPSSADMLARVAPQAAGTPGPGLPPNIDVLRRQQEAATSAANRYATFAAAEDARNRGAGSVDDLRQQIKDAQLEQSALSTAAMMREKEAQAASTIPGSDQLSAYRDYLTAAFPTVEKVSTARQRIRLTPDQIRSVARAAASPLRQR